MSDPQTVKPLALDLEIQEIEVFCNPGCNTSTTSPRCTCRPLTTTTGSLFTARSTT